MEQKDKELLLKDLSARLPYGVWLNVKGQDGPKLFDFDEKLWSLWIEDSRFSINDRGEGDYEGICEIKPYLRPMSSMTEEEIVEINSMGFAYWTTMINNDLRTRGPMSLLDAIITHHKMVKLIGLMLIILIFATS